MKDDKVKLLDLKEINNGPPYRCPKCLAWFDFKNKWFLDDLFGVEYKLITKCSGCFSNFIFSLGFYSIHSIKEYEDNFDWNDENHFKTL